jgi:polyketide cyclase/dehydrase/lipid transport protein
MGVISASASADIAAPIERCFEIAADVERAPSWQRGFDGARVIERDAAGRPLIVDTENDAKVRVIKSRMRFSYDPPRGLRWEQVSGDTKAVVGWWSFEDLGDGRTRATYSLKVDPGRLLGMLVKGPVEQTVKNILVGSRPEELKEQAERS